jgi:hypothetical protein
MADALATDQPKGGYPRKAASESAVGPAGSHGASPAAPLDGIRRYEQVQTGEKLQGQGATANRPRPVEYLPLTTATRLTMTATVKAMDSQR